MTLTEEEKDYINGVFFTQDELIAHTLHLGTSVGTNESDTLDKEEKVKENSMNTALKMSYLENIADLELESELSVIYDSLHERNLGDLASMEILKKIFMLLPHSTFCDGLKWGFTDTVVRDDIYEFIMNMDLSVLEN